MSHITTTELKKFRDPPAVQPKVEASKSILTQISMAINASLYPLVSTKLFRRQRVSRNRVLLVLFWGQGKGVVECNPMVEVGGDCSRMADRGRGILAVWCGRENKLGD